MARCWCSISIRWSRRGARCRRGPLTVGLANGGAAVLLVMTDGVAYRLANEAGGANVMQWIALPPVPGTEAVG
jgi:hypothetical protein